MRDTVPYAVIAEAIDYIVTHWQSQPDLDALAARAGYDPTHFQKTFTAMVGISPKKMIQFLGARHARDLLLQGHSTLDAAYASGISGNGRLHDLFMTVEAATPGEVQKKGKGLRIVYGFHPGPMGEMLIAQTERGICWFGFLVDGDRAEPLRRLHAYWPEAVFAADDAAIEEAARKILSAWRFSDDGRGPKLKLHLFGTNFQLQVWQALLKIPFGSAVSYQAVAAAIGKPTASRAVGSAVGANPVTLLIPCHRVIQASGIVENYGWGTPRKRLLLALETRAT